MWDLIVSVPDHCLSFYFSMSHQAKVYALTQAAAINLRETLLPRLQCSIQLSSQGGHSNPGYSVPSYKRAKGDTLTHAAAVQLRATLLPRLQCPTQQSS